MTTDRSSWSPAELWMARKLAATRRRWTRRAPSRFWQWELGIAIELDGLDRDGAADAAADRVAFYERGVTVIRVRELNEQSAAEALRAVRFAEPWDARRRALGLPPVLRIN